MNRAFAILIATALFGLVVVIAMTEQNPLAGAYDMQRFVICLAAQAVFLIGLLGYCGFAALHATQYLASPQDRSVWLLVIVGLNILGACFYFLTRYQTFRKEGKSRMMSFRVNR